MASAKCGCGKQKTQQLQVAGILTLGDLLALNQRTDDEVALAVAQTRSRITVDSIRKWSTALLEKRARGGGGGRGVGAIAYFGGKGADIESS